MEKRVSASRLLSCFVAFCFAIFHPFSRRVPVGTSKHRRFPGSSSGFAGSHHRIQSPFRSAVPPAVGGFVCTVVLPRLVQGLIFSADTRTDNARNPFSLNRERSRSRGVFGSPLRAAPWENPQALSSFVNHYRRENRGCVVVAALFFALTTVTCHSRAYGTHLLGFEFSTLGFCSTNCRRELSSRQTKTILFFLQFFFFCATMLP